MKLFPKNAKTFLGRLVLYYLLIVAAMFLMQRRLLYVPTHVTDKVAVQIGKKTGVVPWPDDGTEIVAYAREPVGAAKGTIVIFHGNGGFALDRGYYAHALVPHGYRVLLAEFPGYGWRNGKRSEKTFVEDGLRTARLALDAFGRPLVLWGESMGCGVASAIAREMPADVHAVVMLTPWDNLPEIAQARYPFFPAKWLSMDKYDNRTNLKDYVGPVVYVIAMNDEIIPTKHSRRLYDAGREPKRLIEFERAGHNSWPVSALESWWTEVIEFIEAEK